MSRIDDDLHERVKERAEAEGRSVNAVIISLLEDWASALSPRELHRRRHHRRLVARVVLAPRGAPVSRDELNRLTRPAGGAVSLALTQERDAR